MNKDTPGPADPNRNYSYAAAAPLFADSISARQVRRWVETGKLPYIQFPKGRCVRGSDINEFIANARVAAQ